MRQQLQVGVSLKRAGAGERRPNCGVGGFSWVWREAERTRRDLRHAGFAELVEERAVADFEPFGGLLPVPAVGLEHLEDDLAFQILRRPFGDVLKRDGFAEVDVGGDAVFCLSGNEVADERLFAADEDVGADQVFELADVSRPVVPLHKADGAFREQIRRVMEGAGVVVDEVVDEDGKIGESLAQRWEVDGDGVDAKEEVEAKCAGFDLLAEVSVGYRDEPGGDGAGLVAAHAGEGAVLEYLEELGLDREIEAADLIEEEGSEVGLFDASELGSVGSGEGAFFVPEELGFEQGVRDGRTADLDEGAPAPARQGVKEVDAELLAGSTFALEKDGDVGLGDSFELGADSQHGGCSAEKDVQGRKIGERFGIGSGEQGGRPVRGAQWSTERLQYEWR